jgi:hypothetical protein
MTSFPLPAKSSLGDLAVSFQQDDGSLAIKITSEGAGRFVSLCTEGLGVALDPDELRALCDWIIAACATCDAIEATR